ncbi:MAG: hypothetical protein ACTHMM_17190 [Agriterribacter sp.]
MKKRINLIFKIVALGMIGSFVWILIMQLYINPNKLKHGKVRYTIATILGLSHPSDGGSDIDFVFKVNGKTYKGFFNAYKRHEQKGDRVLVRFLEKNPAIHELVHDMSLPDSTVLVPESGWETLP